MGFTSFLTDNRRHICDRYVDAVAHALSKADLAMMLDVNVCEWLCMMEPNHRVADWLTDNFGSFINGRYAKDCGGYTCSVYAGYEGEVVLKDTVTAFVGCGRVSLSVPKNAFVRVCCSGGLGCRIDVAEMGEGSRLVVYATEGTAVSWPETYNDRIETKKLDTL